jgi:hypothetical protein
MSSTDDSADDVHPLQQRADPRTGPESFYGFEPFEHRGSAVSNALIDRLRDEEAV